MMRCFILIILLAHPAFTYSQIPDDSLKKYVDRSPFTKYIATNMLDYDMSGKPAVVLDTMVELFKGGFDDVKIFSALYFTGVSDGVEFLPKLCVLNVNTGKPVLFPTEDSFYHFVNSARKEISNLDKAYLYLFLYKDILNTSQKHITIPLLYTYNCTIGKNSAFLQRSTRALFFMPEDCQNCAVNSFLSGANQKIDAQIINNIHNSTNSKITIYSCSIEPINKSYFPAYRYEFAFNKNKMIDVKISCFEYQ